MLSGGNFFNIRNVSWQEKIFLLGEKFSSSREFSLGVEKVLSGRKNFKSFSMAEKCLIRSKFCQQEKGYLTGEIFFSGTKNLVVENFPFKRKGFQLNKSSSAGEHFCLCQSIMFKAIDSPERLSSKIHPRYFRFPYCLIPVPLYTMASISKFVFSAK